MFDKNKPARIDLAWIGYQFECRKLGIECEPINPSEDYLDSLGNLALACQTEDDIQEIRILTPIQKIPMPVFSILREFMVLSRVKLSGFHITKTIAI